MKHDRIIFIQQFDNGLFHRFRRSHIRIAQAEVIYIFRSIDARKTIAFFEHCPDGGTICYHVLHFLCYHNLFSFLYSLCTLSYSSFFDHENRTVG